MHPLNKLEGFFSKPQNAGAIYPEALYNNLFGEIPLSLHFAEEFEKGCMSVLLDYYDLFCANIHKTKKSEAEEGFFVGKENTVFAQSILNTATKGLTRYVSPFSGIDASEDASENASYVRVKAACKTREQVEKLADILKNFAVAQKSKIYILANNYGDLAFTALPMEQKTTNLELNYGEDFPEVSNKIIESLNNASSGLYLFHGAPGTGKSSYIKYLCSGVLDRKVAYIPVGMIASLTSPDMVPLLMENKDIVLVIEDAEKALLSRDEAGRSDLVSTVLNLTDGFIGSALNISIVATFNTAKENIDEALLRKGRLKYCHEFKSLSVTQAKALAEYIGQNPDNITEDMSLADVYHMQATTGYQKEEERRVGFC